MQGNNLNDFLTSSIEGLKSFSTIESAIGSAITTPSGVTVIPVSKVNMGFISGGVDLPQKRTDAKSIGGGGGTGISVTPLAFLTVNAQGDINLIPIKESDSSVSKIIDLIEQAPDLISKIKEKITKD